MLLIKILIYDFSYLYFENINKQKKRNKTYERLLVLLPVESKER